MSYFFHHCIHKHCIYVLFFTIQVLFSLYEVNFKFTNWHWKNINGQFMIYVVGLDVLFLQIIFLWPLKYTSAEIIKVFITDLLMTKKDAGIHSIKYSIKYRYLNWLKSSRKFGKAVEHFQLDICFKYYNNNMEYINILTFQCAYKWQNLKFFVAFWFGELEIATNGSYSIKYIIHFARDWVTHILLSFQHKYYYVNNRRYGWDGKCPLALP
jgi:hypothetical protein